MTTSRNYRNAEREFIASLSRPMPLAGLAQARATQDAIDASRGQRIPAPDAIEVPLEELTAFERSTFFGDFERAYADTQFGDAP